MVQLKTPLKIRWTAIARYNSFKYLRSFMDGKDRFTQERQHLYEKIIIRKILNGYKYRL